MTEAVVWFIVTGLLVFTTAGVLFLRQQLDRALGYILELQHRVHRLEDELKLPEGRYEWLPHGSSYTREDEPRE